MAINHCLTVFRSHFRFAFAYLFVVIMPISIINSLHNTISIVYEFYVDTLKPYTQSFLFNFTLYYDWS